MWHTNILCVGSETAGDELLWWGGYSGISYLKWIVFIGHLTFKKLPHSRFFPLSFETSALWMVTWSFFNFSPSLKSSCCVSSFLSFMLACEWVIMQRSSPFWTQSQEHFRRHFLVRSEVSELHHWQTPTQPLMLNTDSNDTHDCVS